MAALRRLPILAHVSLLMPLVWIGCRDTEAPRSLHRDLGDGERLLMPVASPPQNPRVKDGQADWHPFRDPSLGEPLPDDHRMRAESADHQEDSGDGDNPLLADLRDLMEEYNGFAANGDVEGLLEFYAQDRQDAMETLFEAIKSLTAKRDALRSAIEEKIPDADDEVTAALTTLDVLADLKINLKSISIGSETQAMGTLRRERGVLLWPGQVEFRLVDDDWYLAFSQAEAISEKIEALYNLAAKLDALTKDLQADQVVPGDLVGLLTAGVKPFVVADAEPPEESVPVETDDNDDTTVSDEENEE